MAVIQCSKLLHFYDSEKYSACPHCANIEKGGTQTAELDAQVVNYAAEYIRKHAALKQAEETVSAAEKEDTQAAAQGQPVSMYAAGWLVCTKGEDYGRDFPLYAGYNYIGTGSGNDIVLKDDRVSADGHCSVVYEEKKNVFYLVPKPNRFASVGEEPVDSPRILQGGQTITVGDTCLELVVFCAGEKRWLRK